MNSVSCVILSVIIAITVSSVHAMDMGIDVSHHNGNINWAAVATNDPPVKFVLVKATEGSNYTDPKFVTNFAGAKSQGFRTGFYHYFRTNSKGINISPAEQVANIGRAMKAVNFDPSSDFFVLDVEETANDTGLSPGPGRLSKEELTNRINELMSKVRDEYATNGMIYTVKSFWDPFVYNNVDLSGFPLWIARYPDLSNMTLSQCLCELHRHTPDPAAGWDRFDYWQFSAKQTINGITGPVDVSVKRTRR